MYKTIRHGENSLQYTILPQNDDFRIEGKLSGSGRSASSGGASTSSASASATGKVKGQRRRRSFFAYLGLIFVCTVIIGAILIPFLVSAECLPNPKEWFLKTKAAFIQHGSGSVPGSGSGSLAIGGDLLPTGSPLLQQSVGRNVQIVNRNGVEQFVIRLNKTNTLISTTAAPPPPPTSTTSSTTTTTTTTTTITTTEAPPPPPPAPVATIPTTTTTREPATNPVQRHQPPGSTITTRIIQVPLLKSAAKKPIMPPVLAKAQGNQIQPNQEEEEAKRGQEVAGNRSNSAWIKTHWAYIDPSTYFQWTGYKAEDSVLLPALLGFALIGVILIITVCLVARNKRTIVSSVRKRNRNDIEEQGAEDNATLLATTNLSDDD
ncbi:hypothetical protein KR074_011818 [Drosophila pseudoananassae]|nr:hypothetical protein KR074_011818 [Drosophila pseudoananassae]